MDQEWAGWVSSPAVWRPPQLASSSLHTVNNQNRPITGCHNILALLLHGTRPWRVGVEMEAMARLRPQIKRRQRVRVEMETMARPRR